MTWRSHAAIVVAVLACSQFRATWSLLLVPYAWLALRKSGSKRQACGIAAALALVAATVASAMFLGAPFPSFLSRTIPMAWSSPGSALGLLVNHCLENELQFLSPTSATVMETALRYEIMATCLVALGVVARPRPQAATSERDESSATAGFILLNLLPVVGVLLLFYDVGGGRDYRALAPHFLISLMLLLSGRAYRWALAVGFVNLALLVPFCEHFSAFHTHRVNCDASRIDTLQQELAGILRFDPHADPWENTVLVTIDAVQYPLLAVSPGIGLSARLQPLGAGEKVEIRSKYILMDARDFEKFLGDQPRLKFVGHTSYGDLYLNLDVGCGASEKFKVESSKPVP